MIVPMIVPIKVIKKNKTHFYIFLVFTTGLIKMFLKSKM